MTLTTTTPPPIDRALIERDLNRMADFLGPLIEARLESIRGLRLRVWALEVPWGEHLYRRLSGYPRQMTYDAMSRLLSLSDEDLGALIDLAGIQLGTWRGYPQTASVEQVAAALTAADRLVGALDE